MKCLISHVLPSLLFLLGATASALPQGAVIAGFAPTDPVPLGCESRTPIASLPYVIDRPGSYVVVCDIETTGTGIQVLASDVTLDLGGHTLTGSGGSGPLVNASPDIVNVTVRNGIVRDWGSVGIDLSGVIGAVLEDLNVAGASYAGIETGVASLVTRCRVTGNRTGGFVGDLAVVRDVTASGNDDYGLWMGTGAVMTGCVFAGNGLSGTNAASAAVVARCSATGNGEGFTLSQQVVLADSISSANQGDGVDLGINAIMSGCTVSDNTGYGIWAVGQVETPRLIEENVVTGNGLVGINSINHGLVRGNTVTGNGSHGIQLSRENCCVGNLVYGNGGVGIYATATHNRIDGNNVSENVYGITTLTALNVIVRNKATLNGPANFDLAPGSFEGPLAFSIASATAWSNFSF